jgi:dihydrofolate reductase
LSAICFFPGKAVIIINHRSRKESGELRRKYKMRKLAVLAFVSLDGVMQAPGGPEEDTSGGFKYGGWTFGYFDDFTGKVMDEQMSKPFDLVLGRKTYEIFASYWPKFKNPIANILNSAKKYVASKTLKKVEWENSELLEGDIENAIKKLKAEDGPELQVYGSSELIQTLLKNDLIDEFRLKIFPITLGKGKRLFGEGTIPAGFRLVESKTSPSGVIVANYIRDGEIKMGSFASLEEK